MYNSYLFPAACACTSSIILRFTEGWTLLEEEEEIIFIAYYQGQDTRYKIFYFPIMEMWLGICDVKFVKPQFFNSEQPLYYKIQTAFYYLITFMTKTKTSLLENQ
jgi:hypothetical protein